MPVALVLACLPALVSAAPAKRLPRLLDSAKDLKLGLPVKDFIALMSTKEIEVTEKGVRRFSVNPNSLPEDVTSLICEFVENKLGYVEVVYAARVAAQRPWTIYVGESVTRFGAPKTWLELAGVQRLGDLTLDESAAWSDDQTVIVNGRARQGSDVLYATALIDKPRLAAVKVALQQRVEAERKKAEEEAKVRAEAEQQRVEAERKKAEEEAKARADAEQKREQGEKARAEVERTRFEEEKRRTEEESTKRMWEEAKTEFETSLAVLRDALSTEPATASATAVKQAARGVKDAYDALVLNTPIGTPLQDAVRALHPVIAYADELRQTARGEERPVSAAGDWQPMAVKVRLGERLLLFPTGVWSVSANYGDCGADGLNGNSSSWTYVRGAWLGALICRIGDDGRVFAVGGSGARIDADNEGVLSCRINDTDVRNNSGQLDVRVVVLPKPQDL